MDTAPAGLSRNRAFWTLWAGHGVSRVGSGVSAIALVIAVYDRTESSTAVGGLLLARALPSVMAPFAGVITDRVDRRLVMIASDLASAGLITAVAFAGPLPLIYGLVVLLGAALAVFAPAERSSIPRLVTTADLPAANSFSNLARASSVFLGSVLGGVLVASIGLRPAFFIDAASFLVSAALIATLPSLAPRDEERVAPAGYWRELREGLAVVQRERVPFTVVSTGFLLVLFAGSVNAVQVILAKSVLDAGDLGYGLLEGAWAVGMLAGSAALIFRSGADARTAYLLSILLMALGLGATGVAPAFLWALAFLAIGGTGNGLDGVSMDTLLQQSVPQRLQGRVFAVSFASLYLAGAVAPMAGGLLAEVLSTRLVYGVASFGLVATWVCARALLAGAPARQAAG